MMNRIERMAKMIGLAVDGEDGHVRVTHGSNFSVLMGSEPTHEALQGICLQINDALKQQGRALEDLTPDEFAALVREVAQPEG
ncbi:MAG TPA: hypothetical protein PKE55_05590 [Kiritimatiellia bacterium]|nr:hypothetical protein [Kiritimatiellia bacterium]